MAKLMYKYFYVDYVVLINFSVQDSNFQYSKSLLNQSLLEYLKNF